MTSYLGMSARIVSGSGCREVPFEGVSLCEFTNAAHAFSFFPAAAHRGQA